MIRQVISEINYFKPINQKLNNEELKKQSERVTNGTTFLDRLLLAEEERRTRGDRTNVEASLILGATEQANRAT